MLLSLPLLQAMLRPCPETWAGMPATPAGRFCARCQHTVHDFSQEADPTAALVAARAASPTGRVCGRFAAAQVARPRLSGRLRRFVVALVLVFGLGLPAHEALAQVRQAAGTKAAGGKPVVRQQFPEGALGMIVEPMPEYKAGGQEGLTRFLRQQLMYPAQAVRDQVEGRVYLSFVVNKRGKVENLRVVKGLHPLLDAEALRVARLMGDWKPGTRSGKPQAVGYMLPVTFKLKEAKPKRPASARQRPLKARIRVVKPLLPKLYDIGTVQGPSDCQETLVSHDTVWTYAEPMPALPGSGGFRELVAYVQRQVRWPQGFGAVDIKGKVYVRFVVGKSGLVRDVQVVKGLEPALDAEAVRAVQTLGRLQPGRLQGWPVPVRMLVPVSFNRE